MSLMKWTYKDNIRGVALKNGDSFKKGDTIPIQVYRFYASSRGGGTTEQTVYYYGNEPTLERIENVMAMPSSQKLFLKGDFDMVEENSTGVSPMPSTDADVTEPSNNKTIMWLGLVVVGYFAYKYYNKK